MNTLLRSIEHRRFTVFHTLSLKTFQPMSVRAQLCCNIGSYNAIHYSKPYVPLSLLFKVSRPFRLDPKPPKNWDCADIFPSKGLNQCLGWYWVRTWQKSNFQEDWNVGLIHLWKEQTGSFNQMHFLQPRVSGKLFFSVRSGRFFYLDISPCILPLFF